MKCPLCNELNDRNAELCTYCGQPLGGGQKVFSVASGRPYFAAFFLVPVFLVFIGIGYYRFFLPGGKDAAAQSAHASLSGRLTPEVERSIAAAGLAYWREKLGGGEAGARVTDFGCHFQVDIIRDGKAVKSLQYQNGQISEM
jgi:cbb3-type cytochrome oxidase subunit 3